MSRRPVCVSCECDLKPERNGVWVVETAGEERREDGRTGGSCGRTRICESFGGENRWRRSWN